VTDPDRYDPGINRTYAEMAGHYGTAILAVRPRRPKDKAKVEVAVQIAQRLGLPIASEINSVASSRVRDTPRLTKKLANEWPQVVKPKVL
jgi:transposase